MSFRVLANTKFYVKQTTAPKQKTETLSLSMRTRRRRRDTLRRRRDISPTKNKIVVEKNPKNL